jgi:hypothetical protein
MSAPRSIPTCVATEPGLFGPRTQIVLGTCACAAASLFVYAVDPSRHAVYPQCLLYNATGLYCAGCGATRALHALLHGRVLDALHDNALFVAALPVVLYVLGTQALAAWRANAWPRVHVQPRWVLLGGTGAMALAMGFMVLRNLPGPAFDWLRPLP